MRVANIIEEGKVGGPQVRMVRVAESLRGRVDTLIIMPLAHSRQFREMCDAHHVLFRALPLTRITKDWRAAITYVLFSPIEIVRLARFLRHEHIDLVHASGGSWQYKAVIAARLAGIPSVWHLNDTFMPDWVRRLFRFMALLSPGFIFTSHRSHKYYGDLVPEGRPRAVVPAPVDTVIFDPEIELPADPDLPSDAPVIGTVANVNPIKGLETLIRAAEKLRAMGYEPHVIVIGAISERHGEYHHRLRALADKLGLSALYFVGARSDVRSVLKQLDVYVCPSESESWGMALWEAMAMALPVVSTDVGDVALHVRDGEQGFIVPVADDAAMADRISRLLDDPDRRVRMGAAAREAAQSFRPEEVARLTLDIYQRVLHPGQPYSSQQDGSERNENG